jgi:hypothetical protein
MMAGAAWALAATLQLGTIDWPSLPTLPYRAPPIVTPQMHEFAGREAKTRNCPLRPASNGKQLLTVELAVLIDASSQVRTVVPRAIDCATVEQYAAGLIQSFARGNLLPRVGASAQWYKTSLTFSWAG